VGFKGEALAVKKDKDGKVRGNSWDLGIYDSGGATGDGLMPSLSRNIQVK
jgi:hypothetical protein